MYHKKFPLVSIVIVEYKNDPYLSGLLSSIGQMDYPRSALEIIIVSILSTHKKIRLSGIPVLQIVVNHQTGYAEAANIGISRSRGTYIFSPNPDIVVEKTALTQMVSYIEKHDEVGIVGPKMFSMDQTEKISPNDLPCKNFNQILGAITVVTPDELAQITKPQEFYWVCGNGIVVKKAVWDKVGKYDESYFLYWEDADFSMKVRQLGYKSVLVPSARLFHKGSGSIGETADQVYYVVRNGRYFLNKYIRITGRISLHLTNALLLISKSIRLVSGKSDKLKTQAFIDGIIDFYRGKRGFRKVL